MLHEWHRIKGRGAGAKKCTRCDYVYIPGKQTGNVPDCKGKSFKQPDKE